MGTSLRGRSNKYLKPVAISFIATLFLYIFVYVLGGIAPFGDRTLTYRDGDQQYIDLLMYFKNVLAGDDSIFFSMSKYLGGNMYAAYTYYLASPFSLLVLFFDKSSMAVCVDIMVMLKACVASSSMALFLGKRFDFKIMPWAMVLLSVSYSMNQYFIPQSSNFMWLDGAYMLPLMLLGVYLCICGDSLLLAISTALSLSFNWYTGIINCIFCCFWALYEWFSVKRANGLFKAVIKFVVTMLAGVLTSGIVLIPSLLSLADRTHGTTNIADVFTLGFIGSPLTYFANYGPGFISTEGSVSTFAGSFVFVSAILFFTLSKADRRLKITNAILALFGIVMFYWDPLVFAFSVFREVESFWYRYGYLGIFCLVFLAASFWANPYKKVNLYPLIVLLMLVVTSIGVTSYGAGRIQETIFALGAGEVFKVSGDLTLLSCLAKSILPLATLGVIVLVLNDTLKASLPKIVCTLILVVELLVDSLMLFALYTKNNNQELISYIPQEEEILSVIEYNSDDDCVYRVSQTSNRCKYNNLELGYNESLAYGFNGISSFLSSPEEAQGYFMQNIGYDFASDTIPIITNTNLAVDSLLGVQYIISDYEIPGCNRITANDEFKNAYVNPYSLPMAFVISDGFESLVLSDNSCENLNRIYSSIYGEDVVLFDQVECITEDDGYTVHSSDNNPVYGWLVLSDEAASGVISIDGWRSSDYNTLFAPTTFVVPTENGVGHFLYDGNVEEVICYELKLDVLQDISNYLNINGGTITEISNNEYVATIKTNDTCKVMMLLPYQDYMEVTVNGNSVEVIDFEGVFPVINVDSGLNEIHIKYKAPHMGMGIASTIIGVLLIAVVIVIDKKCDIIQTLILKKRA
ncbi:MAG: YfhO family protein [Saccharofermentans sp.]|nr:YfhO family protein [Saccharofermentans sp.]